MSNPANNPPRLAPVLLSGGVGSRLWPVSRELYPKQFLPLGQETHSMLQVTCRRLASVPDRAPPVVICNEAHRFVVAEQLRAVGIEDATIILEPVGRNTAPALGLAARHLQATLGDDALMLILPADHILEAGDDFLTAVATARELAADDALVTFGIRPRAPETGYGYIRVGEALSERAHRVAAFVEKPDSATAQAYVASGEYFWNSGMFLMRVGAGLRALEAHAPAILTATDAALGAAARDLDFLRLSREAFEQCPADSIDYAIMEHTDHGAVVPLDTHWSDVGSWSAIWDASDQDADCNVVHGDVLLQDVHHSLVRSESRLVAALGVSDAVIVETPDAVLVADRQRVQDVKQLVNRLKADDRIEVNSHTRVYRPWGSYESLVNAPGFQVKRIVVNAGASLSLQMHRHRAEHWVVVSGEAEVVRDDDTFRLEHDQSTYLPVGSRHRLSNPGPEPLVVIEVQTGDYLGEDDIVRFDDVYGRTPGSEDEGGEPSP